MFLNKAVLRQRRALKELMVRVLALVLFMGLTSCARNLATVDFKYTSLNHISYSDSLITLDVPPKDLVLELSEAFRRQGGTVLERRELTHHPAQDENANLCWEASNEIAKQEFEAYRLNSFPAYKGIDRKYPFTSRGIDQSCLMVSESPAVTGQSWGLMVQFPPRSSNTTIYRPTSSHFFAFTGLYNSPVQVFGTTQTAENVAIDVATRLYIWAWRDDTGRTQVYLQGRPFSGQIEAAPGNSIGWAWWRLANGFEEANVVKNYTLLLQDHYRARPK